MKGFFGTHWVICSNFGRQKKRTKGSFLISFFWNGGKGIQNKKMALLQPNTEKRLMRTERGDYNWSSSCLFLLKKACFFLRFFPLLFGRLPFFPRTEEAIDRDPSPEEPKRITFTTSRGLTAVAYRLSSFSACFRHFQLHLRPQNKRGHVHRKKKESMVNLAIHVITCGSFDADATVKWRPAWMLTIDLLFLRSSGNTDFD